MKLKNVRALTLLEIIIVVIIVGILATMALPGFYKAQLRARDKEADAMLKLMQQAQKVVHLEMNNYIECVSTTDCNTRLRLDLPTENWTFSVPHVTATDFCVQAVSLKSGSGTWHIGKSDNAVISGACPAPE